MESCLQNMFDLQRFEDNAALRSVIDSVHSRYAVRALTFGELDMVSAAGAPELPNKSEDK